VTDVPTTPRRAMGRMRRLRIFEAGKGICILCDHKIDGVREAWTVEHPIALGLGGPDTDENAGPAHERCRREKDKIDVPAIAKAKRMKMRHLGIKKRSSFPKPPPGYRYDWGQRRLVKETA
jgi:5-methylcytosine-specific restriction protein A